MYTVAQISDTKSALTFIKGCYTLPIIVESAYWHLYISELKQEVEDMLECVANEFGFTLHGYEYMPSTINHIIAETLEASPCSFCNDTFDTYLYEREYLEMYLGKQPKTSSFKAEPIVDEDLPF